MKVLLTGCSRGLGFEILKQLLDQNCEVWGVSREAPRNMNHPKFHFQSMDLSKLDHLPMQLRSAFSRMTFDAVIHNAGMGLGKHALDSAAADWKKLSALHFEAPLEINNFAIQRALSVNHPLRIVQVTSISVHVPFRGLGIYSSSKAALEAMGRTYAKEWFRYGVDLINIAPDYMETDMTESLPAEARELILEGIPDKAPLSSESVAAVLVSELLKPMAPWRGKTWILSKRPALKAQAPQAEWISIA